MFFLYEIDRSKKVIPQNKLPHLYKKKRSLASIRDVRIFHTYREHKNRKKCSYIFDRLQRKKASLKKNTECTRRLAVDMVNDASAPRKYVWRILIETTQKTEFGRWESEWKKTSLTRKGNIPNATTTATLLHVFRLLGNETTAEEMEMSKRENLLFMTSYFHDTNNNEEKHLDATWIQKGTLLFLYEYSHDSILGFYSPRSASATFFLLSIICSNKLMIRAPFTLDWIFFI